MLRWGVTHLEERRAHAAAAQADLIAVECEERVLALIDDLAWRERTAPHRRTSAASHPLFAWSLAGLAGCSSLLYRNPSARGVLRG